MYSAFICCKPHLWLRRSRLHRRGNGITWNFEFSTQTRQAKTKWALRENSAKRPIGGDLSVLPFLGWRASGFQARAADLRQFPAESSAVSESLESWDSRLCGADGSP